MARPKPREMDAFSESVAAIQKACPTPLSIFTDMGDEEGQQFQERWDVEVLNLNFEPDKIIWRKLHNDPNIEIVSESEKASRVSTLTFIKFKRRVPVNEPEPEPEPDTFSEPCEDDDPLIAVMWGE